VSGGLLQSDPIYGAIPFPRQTSETAATCISKYGAIPFPKLSPTQDGPEAALYEVSEDHRPSCPPTTPTLHRVGVTGAGLYMSIIGPCTCRAVLSKLKCGRSHCQQLRRELLRFSVAKVTSEP
jgi:hypothetical protein